MEKKKKKSRGVSHLYQDYSYTISMILKKICCCLILKAHSSQTQIVGKLNGQFLHAHWWP